jgi:uncharacterized protein
MDVVDNRSELRYEIRVDEELAGTIRYTLDPGVITLVHTEVEPRHEGEGVGSALVKGALDDIRARDLRLRPLCPFVAEYLRRHPEYDTLVYRVQRTND